jgi:hypothetical protein
MRLQFWHEHTGEPSSLSSLSRNKYPPPPPSLPISHFVIPHTTSTNTGLVLNRLVYQYLSLIDHTSRSTHLAKPHFNFLSPTLAQVTINIPRCLLARNTLRVRDLLPTDRSPLYQSDVTHRRITRSQMQPLTTQPTSGFSRHEAELELSSAGYAAGLRCDASLSAIGLLHDVAKRMHDIAGALPVGPSHEGRSDLHDALAKYGTTSCIHQPSIPSIYLPTTHFSTGIPLIVSIIST